MAAGQPGGRTFYVTCSVFKAENSEQIEAALSRHADMRRIRISLPGDPASSGGQLLPGGNRKTHNHDGYFTPCWNRRTVITQQRLTRAPGPASRDENLMLGLTARVCVAGRRRTSVRSAVVRRRTIFYVVDAEFDFALTAPLEEAVAARHTPLYFVLETEVTRTARTGSTSASIHHSRFGDSRLPR